jgi:voltage-gated potassium channel
MPLLPILAFLRFLFHFFKSIWSALRDPSNPEFRGLLSLVLITLGTGTLVYHWIEGWNFLDSLYFSVTTLTTIGFGDPSPKTPVGKIFTMVYILVGLGILAGFISALATYTVKRQK